MAEAASSSGLVHLTEVDVPGATLAEPLEKQCPSIEAMAFV